MTKVTNIKDAPKDWKTDPNYVYIGRAGKGLSGYFGNPFKLEPGKPVGSTLDKYREYFTNRMLNDAVFSYGVHCLKGKILVCFCHPDQCHGDIIVEYLERDND